MLALQRSNRLGGLLWKRALATTVRNNAVVVTTTPDTEDYLVSHIDPLSLVYAKFNPAMIRMFKQAKSQRSHFDQYNQVMETTSKALISLNKMLIKKNHNGSLNFSYAPKSVANGRANVERILTRSLTKMRSIDELKGVAAAMHILMPQSPKLWQIFDGLVASKLPNLDKDFSLEMSYTINSACRSLRLRPSTMRTPAATVEMLLQQSGSSSSKNVFAQFSCEEESGQAAIGCEVRDNRRVELLVLQMHLLTSQPWTRGVSKSSAQSAKHKLLEDLTIHALQVLSSLSSPVKLSTLRSVWELAPRIDLPDSYMLYKTLYQQVLSSITADPLQIVSAEDTLCSLFESMIASKFKSGQLVQKVFELVQLRGMDRQRISLRLFSALVHLEALPFALYVLESLMKFSSMKLESIISQSSRDNVFVLSEVAKEVFFQLLMERCRADMSSSSKPLDRASATNLMLALLYFHRDERRTATYKLLEQLEFSMVGRVASLSLEDRVMLVHGYALAGRLNSALFGALDQLFQSEVAQMNSRQVGIIIWACGRLNHRPEYLHSMVAAYFASLANLTKMSSSGGYSLSRTLWSLAALQKLTPEYFLATHRLVSASLTDSLGVEINSWIAKQLNQVLTELTVTARGLPADEPRTAMLQSAMDGLSTQLRSTKAWMYMQRREREECARSSSQSHLDVSSILNELGIPHENERVLDNGYYADIFIAPQVLKLGAESKGVVIEFDGPSHYESFLDQPLGPTVMKHKHINCTGYHLIALSYWEYGRDMPHEKKVRVLMDAIRRLQSKTQQ